MSLLGGRNDVNGTLSTYEELSSNSVADDDSSTSISRYNSPSTLSQASGRSLALVGSGGPTPVQLYLQTSGSAANTGDTTSTVAAASAGPCNGQVDSLPCSFSVVTNAHIIREVLDLRGAPAPGTVLAPLISTSPADATARSWNYVRRSAGSGGDGQILSSVQRLPGTVSLGGLPVVGPNGWTSGWIILSNNYRAVVDAEAGVGAAAPSVQLVRSGGLVGPPTVLAWNGNGYNVINITAAGGTINLCSSGCGAYGSNYIAPLSYCNTATGNSNVSYRIDITGSLKIGASYTTQQLDAFGNTLSATAVAGSPLTGSITYQATKFGSSNRCAGSGSALADITMSVDLGSTVAQATYQPKP